MYIAILCISAVAICTERVEAKVNIRGSRSTDERVAICTERVEAKFNAYETINRNRGCNLHGACGGKVTWGAKKYASENVAICTERVEAKLRNFRRIYTHVVAICTERVEAKYLFVGG